MTTNQELESELLWFLAVLIVPLTVLLYPRIQITMIHYFPILSTFNEKRLSKVIAKTIRLVYFTISFTVCCIGFFGLSGMKSFGALLRGDSRDIHLTVPQDRLLKIGLCLVGSCYVTDLVYGRKHLTWAVYLHHSASLIVFILMFPNSTAFGFAYQINHHVLSRFYASWFGLLLSSLFLMFIASLYYYLGPPDHYRVRMVLYSIAVVVQIIFIVGQFSMSVYLKILHFRHGFTIISLLPVVLFQICILPSQFLTLYDLFCIIKYKINGKVNNETIDHMTSVENINVKSVSTIDEQV